MAYTVREAKAKLGRLLKDARKGKEVLIAGADNAVVVLVPIILNRKKRKPGRLKGKISYSPDAFARLTRKERKSLGFD